jgi:hypothetical protein
MTDEHVINTMMIEEMSIDIKQTGGQAKVQMESCVCYKYQDKRTREKFRLTSNNKYFHNNFANVNNYT